MKAREIIYNLKINKQQLYRSLKRLRNRGIVKSNLGFPATFIADSFEKALKVLIKEKNEQAQIITEKKDALLNLWDSIAKENLES